MKTIAKPLNNDGYLFACEEVHISQVKQGDTVYHKGEAKTVGQNSLQKDFCGYTLFGDPYLFGCEPVIRFLTYKTGCLIPASHAPYLFEIRRLEVEGKKTQCEIIDYINSKYNITE